MSTPEARATQPSVPRLRAASRLSTAGASKAVAHRGLAEGDRPQLLDLSSNRGHDVEVGERSQPRTSDGDCRAAADGRGRLVEPEHRLPQALGVGVDDAESDVVGEGTKVGDMVVNPFQLQQHGANNPVILGHFDAGCFSTA